MGGAAVRVFLNASSLPERPAGAGVYTLQLASALAGIPGVEVTAASPRPIAGTRHWPVPASGAARRFLWEVRSLGDAVRRAGAEVYHGTHFYTPRRLNIPRVATIHDLTFFRLPRRYGLAHREYYRTIARTARHAERVIVPSGAVASDAVRHLHMRPERIRVIAEAPRAGLAPAPAEAVEAVRGRYGLNGPYLMCLGTAEPGKRTVDALRAMARLRESNPEATLALAGGRGPLSAALEAEAARLGVQDRVRLLGYVPDEELPALLTGATALVFPSLFEGFGLPPVEAMACGTPVISSSAPAMTEVLEQGVIFVPLRDPESIARAARRLLDGPAERAEYSAQALAQAGKYSWERAAEETAAVYGEVTG